MNQGSNGEQLNITKQQVASGSNVSERDQRGKKRNHNKHETSVAKQDDDVVDLQNTIDHQGPADSSSSFTSYAIDFSHVSNDEPENITFSTSNNDGHCNHTNFSLPTGGSNVYHSVNESNNRNTMFASSPDNTDNESTSHHLLFKHMHQAEYNLHKLTQGTARFNNEQIACIELAHILDKCDAPKIVFDEIIKCASKHGENLTNNPPSRQTFYSKLERTLSFKNISLKR